MSVSKSTKNALNQNSKSEIWKLVDKNGKEIKTTKLLKTYTSAYKMREYESKNRNEEIYIVNIKKSSEDELATIILISQEKPNFKYKEIHH